MASKNVGLIVFLAILGSCTIVSVSENMGPSSGTDRIVRCLKNS